MPVPYYCARSSFALLLWSGRKLIVLATVSSWSCLLWFFYVQCFFFEVFWEQQGCLNNTLNAVKCFYFLTWWRKYGLCHLTNGGKWNRGTRIPWYPFVRYSCSVYWRSNLSIWGQCCVIPVKCYQSVFTFAPRKKLDNWGSLTCLDLNMKSRICRCHQGLVLLWSLSLHFSSLQWTWASELPRDSCGIT